MTTKVKPHRRKLGNLLAKGPVDERFKKIGAKLKELRIEAGYTSKEFFAYDCKVARRLYYKLEAGQNMTIKTLLKILDFYQLSLTEFFNMIEF